MSRLRHLVRQPWFVMPVLAVLVLGGWVVVHRGGGGDAAADDAGERVVTATEGTIGTTVSAQGTLAAADTADLSFAAAGTVTAVKVVAGQTVRKGQVLATIDTADLAAALADAQATRADAQAKLADDADGGASDAQLAADRSSVATADDQVADAQAGLAGASLVAPFAGKVASVDVTVGEQLTGSGSGGTSTTGSGSGSGRSAGTLGSSGQTGTGDRTGTTEPASGSSGSTTPDVQIVTPSSFTVEIGVDASDIGKVKIGQSATVAVTTAAGGTGRGGFGGFGGGGFGPPQQGQAQQQQQQAPATTGTSATGKVTAVAQIADASSGVASYPVTVTFSDTSGEFNAGANVQVDVAVDKAATAILIPSFAVTTADDGTSTITVRTDHGDETRTVTTGRTQGASVQITKGLRAGEQVVLRIPGRTFGGTGAGAG